MPVGTEEILKQNEAKLQLRKFRTFSLNNRDELTEQLISAINQKENVDLFLAGSADQAVHKIKNLCGEAPLVINKSAVVLNELKSKLEAEGVIVLESYYDEFNAFENRFQDFRMLPKLEFDSIWRSFSKPDDLTCSRRKQARGMGYKKYVGLLGVNAVSAEEGAVFFLQHMHNIRSIVTQAEKIILVATLDKIVRNFHEAIFQTKCMAAFGAESLPLYLHNPEKASPKINDIPRSEAREFTSTIHLILLDNGRSQILGSDYRDLLACIGCRACLRVCPAASYFNKDKRLSPRDYIYSFLSGSIPSVDYCIQCRSCRAICPLDVDIPGFIREARINKSKWNRPVADHLLAKAELFERIGRTAPHISKIIYDNTILRWFGEKITGISRKRNIPTMHRIDLEKWLDESEKRDTRDNQYE